MNVKILSHQLHDLLADPNAEEYLTELLPELRSNIKDSYSRIRWQLLSALITVVAFELLIRGAVTELSIGPLRVTDLALMIKLAPVAFSFLYYATVTSMMLAMIVRSLHDHIQALAVPTLAHSPIRLLLHPSSSFHFLNVFGAFGFAKGSWGPAAFVSGLFAVLLYGLVLLFPVGYAVYMYFRCFALYGPADVILWGSVGAALLFALQGLVNIAWFTELDPSTEFSL